MHSWKKYACICHRLNGISIGPSINSFDLSEVNGWSFITHPFLFEIVHRNRKWEPTPIHCTPCWTNQPTIISTLPFVMLSPRTCTIFPWPQPSTSHQQPTTKYYKTQINKQSSLSSWNYRKISINKIGKMLRSTNFHSPLLLLYYCGLKRRKHTPTKTVRLQNGMTCVLQIPVFLLNDFILAARTCKVHDCCLAKGDKTHFIDETKTRFRRCVCKAFARANTGW